ncbi:sugar phosphate isomerase/epimerase family protein [Paenibacillus tepidiphilus]|uniref:sugar phosphate isomerase/epimerase family protein n=1 Tax=Paenibacillus tepidiphilus TaxID=2608683 RepID=UPI0012384742|nr:sugar phosphate isomerase/epimerase family protein [Paenibacillus tepidiphilus]
MNLSISNIAWNAEEDDTVFQLLNAYNITALEFAPTKIWSTPIDCSREEILDYRLKCKDQGIKIVAMQSLLFGQPQLTLFEDENARNQMKKYLKKIIEMAGVLGIKAVVFGSPKNRLSRSMSKSEQLSIASGFFYEIGQYAVDNNLKFCIEPNPQQYGCDFVTNTQQGIELVKEVNHPGFQLHLDTGALILNEENFAESIEASLPYLAHFHISEPYLELVGSGKHNHHHEISKILKGLHYENYISIEMKNAILPSNIESVKRALNFVSELY